jgi:hypothetical protein
MPVGLFITIFLIQRFPDSLSWSTCHTAERAAGLLKRRNGKEEMRRLNPRIIAVNSDRCELSWENTAFWF